MRAYEVTVNAPLEILFRLFIGADRSLERIRKKARKIANEKTGE